MVHANLEADPGPDADHPWGDAVFYQYRRLHRVIDTTNNLQNLQFPDPDGRGPDIVNQPNFFRLERRGRTLSGYASFDGKAWKLIGSDVWQELDPDQELLVGFAYSKHGTADEGGTVRFTDYAVQAPSQPEIFDNDRGNRPRVIYTQDFNGVANGRLPPEFVGNFSGEFRPQVVNGRLRMTVEGVTSNATSAFLREPFEIGSGELIIEYTAYAVHSGITRQPVVGDPNPADGMTLAVVAGQDPDLLGGAGGGLGYDGITRGFDRARPSFAVESDTWAATYDNEGAGAPANDGAWHLGINTGGNMNSVAINSRVLPDLFSRVGVRHRVVYKSDGRVEVFVGIPGGGAGGGADLDEPAAEAEVDPLSGEGDDSAVVGFTAATGGATQTSEVDDVTVSRVECSDNQEQAVIVGPGAAEPGDRIVLDGTRSTTGVGDVGETLTYRWQAIQNATLTGDPLAARGEFIVGNGEVILRLTVDDGHCSNADSTDFTLDVGGGEGGWTSYDVNADASFNIADPVAHLNFLFGGGDTPQCEASTDFNGDGQRNITDPVGALNHLFGAGPEPAKGTGCQPHAGCADGPGC